MTASFDELRAGLASVAGHLRVADDFARVAGVSMEEALAILVRLSEQHPESLVPAPLSRAVDELERTLRLMRSGGTLVADIESRL